MKTALTRWILTTTLAVVAAGYGGSAAAVKDKAADLVRDASRECREAKSLRRSNLEKAQEHYRQYQELMNRAIDIDQAVLDDPTPEIERVQEFCKYVKRDLERAEALPVFEKGLAACGEARVALSNNAFEEARSKYDEFQKQKERALAISDSVLDVYENSYELRLCNRLDEDIALAEEEYQKELKQRAQQEKREERLYRQAVAQLEEAAGQCRGAQNIINDRSRYNQQSVDQIQSLLDTAKNVRAKANSRIQNLKRQGNEPDSTTARRIERLQGELDQCEESIPRGLRKVKLALKRESGGAGEQQQQKQAKKGPDSEFRQIVGAPAEYPRRAVVREIEGYVVVEFTVTKKGNVDDIKVVEAKPEGFFEESVKEAVSKYKFQPRIRNGKPVDAEGIQKKIVFKLQ